MTRITNVTVELNVDEDVREITQNVFLINIKDSILNGDLQWEMKLRGDTINSDEALLLRSNPFLLRLSHTQDGDEQSTGWLTLVLDKSCLYTEGGMPILHMMGRNRSLELMQKARFRAFKTQNVVEIMGAIAKEYRLNLITSGFSQTLPATLKYQLGDTDWKFLALLRNDIAATSGQRKAWLRLEGNNLHLFTLNYSQPTVRTFGIGTDDDRLGRVSVHYFGREIDRLGGSSLRMLGFDLENKEFIDILANDPALPHLAGKLPRPFGAGEMVFATTGQSTKAVTDTALLSWSEKTSKYFGLNARVVADLTLQPGQIVEFAIADAEGNESSFGGKYPVYEVAHHYQTVKMNDGSKPSTLETHLSCFRRTSFFGSIDASGANLSRGVSVDTYGVNKPVHQKETIVTAEELP